MDKPSEEEIKKLSRYFAIKSNNEFWTLSEKELDDNEKNEILLSAFASLYHWRGVGNDENKYLAHLAVARALTINDIPLMAVKYATQAYDYFLDAQQDWIKAFSHAILSHALLINGEIVSSAEHYKKACQISEILNEEDKGIFYATFKFIPEPEILS